MRLDAGARRRALEAMGERPLDVLVIGGGITGAGVALDAASRGLSVALVEGADFASGTSGRSSRLIHGGIRYLRHGEVGLVRESLLERDRLLRLAPHLVRPMPFLITAPSLRHRATLRTGLAAYDSLTWRSGLPRHRRVGRRAGARLAPALSGGAAGHTYWDGRTDDARLTLTVIREAAGQGALVANHAPVRELRAGGATARARVADEPTGSSVEVSARVVVNATGAWADRVHALAARDVPRLRPSKGVHLVFRRERFPLRAGLMVPSVAGRGAFIFAIPWGPRVYAGTTDTPYAGALEAPGVDEDDAGVILRSLGRVAEVDLREDDVVASWAGVRPLLDTGRASTRDLSRRHLVYEDPPGLVTVTGGKLTTYRAMAEETVDAVCRRLGRGGPTRTRTLPLGLTGPLEPALGAAAAEARRQGHPEALGLRLVALYGDDWRAAMVLLSDDPSLAAPVVEGLPVRRVEVVMGREREMAMTDDDVLVRRTRLTTMDARAATLAGRLPALRSSGGWPRAGR